MLLILSALIKKDGSTLAVQIAILHAALREEAEARKWDVARPTV